MPSDYNFVTLITEPKDYSKKALAVYKSLGQVYFWDDLKKSDINETKKNANVLVVRLKYKIDRKWID